MPNDCAKVRPQPNKAPRSCSLMRLIDRAIALIPFKYSICAWAALWPLRYRTQLSYRVLAKFARTLGQSQAQLRLTTNLGIADGLRIRLPITAQSSYLFGTPRDYRGERSVLFLARHLAPDCDAIADIGANWGYHTYYYALHAPNLPIYSFEANAALSQEVRRGAAENQLTQVHCINRAIAERSGVVSFYLDTTDDLSSSLTQVFAESGHRVEKTTVAAESFDEFAATLPHTRWLLKVDVESAEFLFLDGALQSIALGKIRYLIIELLRNAREQGFVARLLALGFHAYYLNDLQIEPVDCDDGRYTLGEYNWLFCRDSPSELAARLRGTAFKVSDR